MGLLVADGLTTLVGCGVGGEDEGAGVGREDGEFEGAGVGCRVVGAEVGERDGCGVNSCIMVNVTGFISTS